MRERAELVDGQVVVESAVGAGTRVRLEVPIAAATA
jgi:signal transduction histidine kinase